MQTRSDVADVIGVSDQRLCYILYGRRDRDRYYDFKLAKASGGYRVISAPPKHLLWYQRQLLIYLYAYYKPKACVHGFVAQRSILSNARLHQLQTLVATFDLQNFFPSIHFGRVRGVFLKPPFSFGCKAAEVIAQICCRGDGVLPQGGAMSPLVSNLVCRSLDNDLLTLARESKIRYSRYADDLSFSTSRSAFPSSLVVFDNGKARPGEALREIANRHSFTFNSSKGTCRSRKRRQEVTGLTVNQFPNVNRKFIRQIEGALHAVETFGAEQAQKCYEAQHRSGGGAKLIEVIRGRIAYLKMVRGSHDFLSRRLARKFNRVYTNETQRISVCSLGDTISCPRTTATSEWRTWVKKYSEAVKHLVIHLPDTSESGGTAFHIGAGMFATAQHLLISNKGDKNKDFTLSGHSGALPKLIRTNPPVSVHTADVGLIRFPSLSELPRVPTQLRLPEIGEEIAAIGFPVVPLRNPSLVLHIGTVEMLSTSYHGLRFIQVSFQSGGGLSGGCLLDKSGYLLGVMTENVFMCDGNASNPSGKGISAPPRAYGQAVPAEYLDELLHRVE